jgi:nucleotide-binding universal stress UspA family protein
MYSVLVPLDGSGFAEQALPWALTIARRTGATLDLVRVHVLYAMSDPSAGFAPYDPVMEAQCEDEEQLYLDATAKWLAPVARVPITSALVHGFTADGVLERAVAVKADLIVMTTHGLGPVGRFFMGSVADDIIRRGPAPVLLVPYRNRTPGVIPEPRGERIIIPLDGSALAEGALGPALELADPLQASCTLLRVVRNGESQAEAENYLKRLAGRLRRRDLRLQTRVAISPNPVEAILQEAGQKGDSLIAMASHGRGGVMRMLMGSVADKVIRNSPAPVLVCRPGLSGARVDAVHPSVTEQLV